MNGILRRQACQAASVKSDAVELIIHGIRTVWNIVCHKVDLFILLVDTDQLLNDQFFLRCVKEISFTDAFVFCQAVAVKMGKAISLTLPESVSSVTGNKVGKQIASVAVQQPESAEVEKLLRCLTDHDMVASVLCVTEIKASLLVASRNPGKIEMAAVLHPFDSRFLWGGKYRIKEIRSICLHQCFVR